MASQMINRQERTGGDSIGPDDVGQILRNLEQDDSLPNVNVILRMADKDGDKRINRSDYLSLMKPFNSARDEMQKVYALQMSLRTGRTAYRHGSYRTCFASSPAAC